MPCLASIDPLCAVTQAVGALVQVLNASSVPGKEGAAVALRHLSCGRAGATLKAVKPSKEEKDAQVRQHTHNSCLFMVLRLALYEKGDLRRTTGCGAAASLRPSQTLYRYA